MNRDKLLVAVIVLQSLVLLGQWSGNRGDGAFVSTVLAAPAGERENAIPDAGAQRIAIANEIKTVNGKLDKLIDLLQGGELQVRVRKDDDKE